MDDDYFEEDDDIDIDIIDDISNNNNNNNDTDKKTIVQLNKEIKLSLLLSQKEILIKYLKNINIDKELVQLLNENINLVISNQFNKENNNNNSNKKPISINQSLNIDNEYIKHTQTYLSESVSSYHKLNSKDSIICNKQIQQPYDSNKIDKFQVKRFKRVHEKSSFQIPIQHNDTVQITAPKEEIEKRIKTFNSLKKSENGKYNIIEFIDEDSNGGSTSSGNGDDTMSGTSRCLAVPPSKMKVTKAYNLTGPLDHHDSNSSIIQQPSIDDRLSILENHLKLVVPPVPIDIYQRVKLIEQKMLSLEHKNPVLFKDLYDEMKQNSTVVHTSKVLKVNNNNNNNNSNNNNTTTTNTNNNTTTSSPNIFTIKFKK